ncbi:MAG TPA: magnesium transporter [Geminicoccaceae bacterium]
MAEVREPEAKRDQDAPAELSEELIREVEQALRSDATDRVLDVLDDLHVADQADLLEQLPAEDREAMVEILKEDLDPELLTHLHENVRADVLEQLGPEQAAAAIAELDTDDAIDVLSYLGDEDQMRLLGSMPASERAMLEQGLAFPEDSAGRLMQRQVVAIPEFWTVGQTIDYLRAKAELPDEFYDIYIINPRFEPVGSIPLSKVLRSGREVLLHQLKLKELRLIPAEMDQEEVAFLFRQYGLVSAPVIDDRGRLIGVITVDDVVDVLEEEAEEDFLALGGAPDSDIFASPIETGKKRFPWLLINLGTAIIASIVIAQFEGAIDQLVALAVLMPIVASMGGNGGTQTLSVVIRALATRELTARNAYRVLGREFIVGGLNGLLFLVVGVLVAVVWFGNLMLGVMFGIALLVTLIFAAVAGVALPMLFDRLGLDPAVSSGVFLTTVTDVVGFFTFLGLATLFLL